MKFDLATRCIAAHKGQDRIFARVFDDVAILAVADGAGGSAGGELAAQIFISEAAKIAPAVEDPHDEQFWVSWLERADALICGNPNAGETTAVIAAIGAKGITGASAGDSSLWLVGANQLHDLTENQRRRPFLGSGSATPKPFFKKLVDETVLLASDGLTKYAAEDRLAGILRSSHLETAADALVEAVRLPNGSLIDDVSCLLCRVNEQAGRQVKPPKRKNRFKVSNWF